MRSSVESGRILENPIDGRSCAAARQAEGRPSLENGSAFALHVGQSSVGIGRALRLGISPVDSLAISGADVTGKDGPESSHGGLRHPRSDGAGDVRQRDGAAIFRQSRHSILRCFPNWHLCHFQLHGGEDSVE
jgi:hypothetical protein